MLCLDTGGCYSGNSSIEKMFVGGYHVEYHLR